MFETGRGERIRTSDPHNPIVVRYQAAPRPARGAKDTANNEGLEVLNVFDQDE